MIEDTNNVYMTEDINSNYTPEKANNGYIQGLLAAIGANLIWGIFPIYMHALQGVPALEILSHRIAWSLPTSFLIMVLIQKNLKWMKVILNPKILFCYAITASLLAVDWLMYVWAINHNLGIEASLGYFIGPLVNVLLGFILFRERPEHWQWIGISLAFISVAILVMSGSSSIWIAIVLASCISFYGAIHRYLPLAATQGFVIEMALLFVPAFAFIYHCFNLGVDNFVLGDWSMRSLLILAGPMTAIPFTLYTVGVKHLKFSFVGIIQYIAPSCIFLTAYFIFRQDVSPLNWIAYIILWLGVASYTISSFKKVKA